MIDVILAGFGLRGRTRLRSWPRAGGRIAAIVEQDEDVRKGISQAGIDTFANLEEALSAHATAQLVDICTPPQSHKALMLQALQGRRHVLCEKPFVSTVADGREIETAAASADRMVVVMHNYLGSPALRSLKHFIDTGSTGTVFAAHCTWLESHRRDRQGIRQPEHWVHSMKGGRLEESLPHALYALINLLDDPSLEVVHATFDKRTSYPWVKADTLSATLSGEKGTASLYLSFGVDRDHLHFSVTGSRGAAEASFDFQAATLLGLSLTNRGKLDAIERMLRLIGAGGSNFIDAGKYFLRSVRRDGWDEPLLKALVGSIENGTPPPVSLQEAIATVRLTREICDRLVEKPGLDHLVVAGE